MTIRFGEQTTGATMADAVVWRWFKAPRRWTTTLKDRSVLNVFFVKRGVGRSYWRVECVFDGEVWLDSTPYLHPDLGQRAAFEEWERRRAPKLCIEIVETATGMVEKKLGPFASVRVRDKADDGVNINLNHERFHTRFVS